MSLDDLGKRFEDGVRNLNKKLDKDNFVCEEDIIKQEKTIRNFINNLNGPQNIKDKYHQLLDGLIKNIDDDTKKDVNLAEVEYNEKLLEIEKQLGDFVKTCILHYVNEGETISDISNKYYGNGYNKDVLKEIGSGDNIKANANILLPKELSNGIQIKQEYNHLDPFDQMKRQENGESMIYPKPQEGINEEIEIGGEKFKNLGSVNIPTYEQIGDTIDKKQKAKIDLILEGLQLYIFYLKDIRDNIDMKGIRKLDEDLDSYIQNITDIGTTLKYGIFDPKVNSNDNLLTSIDKIFSTGEKINSLGFGGVKDQLTKLKSSLISIINSENIDYSKSKFELLKTMREIDKNDRNMKYNLSSKIGESLLDDILNNEKLLQDPNIKVRFEKIKNTFSNPDKFVNELVKSYEDKTLNWGEMLGEFQSYYTNKSQDYLKQNGIDIRGALIKINDYLEKSLGIKQEKIIKEQIKDKIIGEYNKNGKKYSQDELSDGIQKGYVSYKENIKDELKSMVKKLGVEWTLKAFKPDIDNLRKEDEKLDLYASIEGLGSWQISDKKLDEIIQISQELAIQVALMYVSGGVGNLAVKGLSGIARWESLTSVGRVLTAGVVDGASFHLTYNTLHNIRQGNELTYNLDNLKDWTKDILFISALRGLNSIKIGAEGKSMLGNIEDMITLKGDKMTFTEKVWNVIGVKGISISAEATTLVGIGSGINIMFGDGIINNPDEILHIISMVIGLRALNKGAGETTFLVKKVNGKIQVNQLEKITTENKSGKNEASKFKQEVKQENKPPNTGNEGIKLIAGLIPLSELFERGQDLEEYELVRDKLINEGLTKHGSQGLIQSQEFQKLKNEFVDGYLNKPAIQEWLNRPTDELYTQKDKEKIRQGLLNDFDNMIRQLGAVESVMKHIEGEKEEDKQKIAIRELFKYNEDVKLGEVLVGMVEQYYNIIDNQFNIKEKINK